MDRDSALSTPACSQCGGPLVLREPQFGVPYWACGKPHNPPEVAPASQDLGYATALIRSRVVDPIDRARVAAFEADSTLDPAQFLDAVCERLAVCIESDRERERERSDMRGNDGSTTPDTSGQQVALDQRS